MELKIENPSDGVYHAKFATRYECAATFLRLEEFYESPFKGIYRKHFTLEEYMDRYAQENGNFTYTTDWEGFNVPGNIVRMFFKRSSPFWHNMLCKETILYNNLVDVINSRKRFYLIGTSNEDGHDAIDHEYAHGFWYLNKYYRADQKHELSRISKRNMAHLEKKLLEKGYRKSVFFDELQAYFSTSTPKELDIMFGSRLPKRVIKRCRAVFDQYRVDLPA